MALESPSASISARVLAVDIESDLAKSALAGRLVDPKTRESSLKALRPASLKLSAGVAKTAQALDQFADWLRFLKTIPAPADAANSVANLLQASPAALLADSNFLAARGRFAELYLIDRLDPTKRSRADQIANLRRLRMIGVISYLASGGPAAQRALRIPFCLAILFKPARLANLRSAAQPTANTPSASASPGLGVIPTLAMLRQTESALRRAFSSEVTRVMEKNDDIDYDQSPPSRGAAKPPKAPAVGLPLADLVVNLRSDSATFSRMQSSLLRRHSSVLTSLGLKRNPSLDDALDAIHLAKKQLINSNIGRPRFLGFSGGRIWYSPDALLLPLDGAPSSVGKAKAIGAGPLYRVLDEVVGYVTAQLSDVYNVPMGSSKEREIRLTERSEEASASFKSKVSEQETETQSDERFSLAAETRKVSAFDASARAGGSFSASYGTVAVEGSAEAGFSARSESTEGMSSAYAKNVVSRASSKITERVEEMRSLTLFRERLSAEKESFSNSSPAHITGFYFFINEVHQTKLVEFGRRLMLEVIVPKPGANLLWAPAAVAADPSTPQPPPEFDVLLDDPETLTDPAQISRAISRETYLELAAKYGARDVPTPPEAVKMTMKSVVAGEQTTPNTFITITKSDESLRVPDGYEALEGWLRFLASHKLNNGATWYRVMVGTSQYKFKGGNASTRTFSRQLDIPDEGGFRGTIPVTISGTEDRAGAAHVLLRCTPTEETMNEWRAAVFSSLQVAHKRALQDYQDSAATSNAAAQSRNPEQLRRLEREEIKRGCLSVITGQQFETFNALPGNQHGPLPPTMRFDEAEQEGSWIQFFETSMEWENADFVLYPYFWSDRKEWARLLTLRVDDPKHEEFLRAGAARVLLPVRPGFEAAVLRYLESAPGSPVLWDGLDPETITLDSPLHLAVWQELKERQGQLSEQPVEIASFRHEVPTNHRVLQAGALPAPPAGS